MPFLVAISARVLGFYTRSGEVKSIMIKTYFFLVFMVIIMPTFGYTYFSQFLNMLRYPDSEDTVNRWKCFFLPDSGSFFINYTIFAAFSGNTFELIRLPAAFMYMCRMSQAKSEADQPAIAAAIRNEFPFGEVYAQYLLIFTMTIMFSLTCPLITPFGLIYFVFKHHVDKHNLYYVFI